MLFGKGAGKLTQFCSGFASIFPAPWVRNKNFARWKTFVTQSFQGKRLLYFGWVSFYLAVENSKCIEALKLRLYFRQTVNEGCEPRMNRASFDQEVVKILAWSRLDWTVVALLYFKPLTPCKLFIALISFLLLSNAPGSIAYGLFAIHKEHTAVVKGWTIKSMS